MSTDPAASLHDDWSVDGDTLRRSWSFVDFASALSFVNRVGALAEERNHHPDIELGWGRVAIALTTHDVGGLTGQDYDLAQAIDGLKSA